jgi:hypothetical protein
MSDLSFDWFEPEDEVFAAFQDMPLETPPPELYQNVMRQVHQTPQGWFRINALDLALGAFILLMGFLTVVVLWLAPAKQLLYLNLEFGWLLQKMRYWMMLNGATLAVIGTMLGLAAAGGWWIYQEISGRI